jgi:hypothetical protein
MDTAEIIFLPKITPAKQTTNVDIAITDIVLLFLSILKMAKERLSATQFNELKKYFEGYT